MKDKFVRASDLEFVPGSEVWVLEHDAAGDYTDDFYCAMFLAQIGDYVITADYIWGSVDRTLKELAKDTREDGAAFCQVVEKRDCFATKEAARDALDDRSDVWN